ncbi:MAG: hypothetical protein R3320_11675 [Nitriliruptorales bacterium]|nr:hypothetical protein [Nitriliruptorales bacterium]
MEIPDGPLAYRSDQPAAPLTEEEQAILAFAACGITGTALADWHYGEESGGEMIARSAGRTISSADAVHTASVFVIDDDATWLARRPQELPPEQLAEVIELTREDRFVDAWRTMRVKIADSRAAPPTEPPYNLVPNEWSLYSKGTTFFLPVSSFTYAGINAGLEFLNERSGFFLLDERRMFLPAGLKDFAKSNGGHLDDDPRNGKAMPLAMFERLGGELLAVEQGMILQNLGLACQAMGLSGFPVFAAHEESWFEALGFRMEEMPLTEYAGVPFPASTLLKVTGKNPTMRYPVGLERDGEVLLKSYAPPYYPSMEAAVHAVIEDKYGPGGIYAGGDPGVYDQRESRSGWRDPDEVGSHTPEPSKRAVEAVIAVAEYTLDRYGRYPATYPPFHTLMGFQAGHIDEGFYDTHYRPGSLSDTHRDHERRWHGQE